jgi:hypothetical protein
MKTKVKFLTLVIFGGLFFTACEKDDPIAKPVINMTELGYENSKMAYQGDDLHVEADVIAEGKIDKIEIVLHPEGEHMKKSLVIYQAGEWETDTTFTEFSGLKNATFHKHIAIPKDAEPGHYHFHFSVTDLEGNQAAVEDEIEIKIPLDALSN